MRFDIFFSICQTEVDGYMPDERTMFENFFDQVRLADRLGFGTAWVAETHLSCEVHKRNPNAVIPNFVGEIGLNTDILQLAHKIFSVTQNIHVGSAIRNILCNGGPIAHAEAVRTFLLLHGMDRREKRFLDLGFAAGRFDFSNLPYGVCPRNDLEKAAWPALKGKVFHEAVEIFLRLLRGEVIASRDIAPKVLTKENFRNPADWDKVVTLHGKAADKIEIPPFWEFDSVQVIPKEAPLDLLRLTIGTHDTEAQKLANKFLPTGVFNLSITPNDQIEKTHAMMQQHFHKEGGDWTRSHMPRTVLVFLNNNPRLSEEERNATAKAEARKAIANYWKAMEGTLDEAKVSNAVYNALVGSPGEILQQMKSRFHRDDRLMLWFDFNNHNNDSVKESMRQFMENVAPHV